MLAGSSSTLALLVGTALASPFKTHLVSRHNDTLSVNLGYEIHTGTRNSSGGYYIFSNIPYAEQPVDDLRFNVVGLPTGNSSTVNNGSTDVMCMQAYPEWIVELEAEAYGVSTEVMEEILYAQSGQTEACLMLDEAPVLVWMHGGGFTYGSKTSTGDPAGIISRSMLNESEGVIFISINYRLGLFGWLGGGDVTPNLGFYDQRVAFEWVKEYIPLFGGDPDRVTVIGESAGAASLLHHITSYGGEGPLPFAQAVIQSPAFQFNLNLTDGYDKTLAGASNLTGESITNVTQLTALDSATLQAVNFDVVLGATQGLFIYGPAPDGSYVPALPQVLLAEGKFHSDVKVVAGHNSLEAAPFVPSSISTEADLISALELTFPEVSNSTLTYILDALYPSSDYESEFLRGVQIISDSDFSCSTRYIAQALNNETYNYIFAYPPGYHAEDLSYTFFNGDTSTLDDGLPVEADLAYALQDYIVGFAITGDPSDSPAGTALEFPVYGSNASVVEFAYAGLVSTTDDMAKEPCAWWQEAMIKGLV
ncbi:Lipase 2 [Cytospora mali]|uniref:Carboxylic ester hydrolase n=1 Tax=Cytospora mali TaxID=578113 RepID=A0A194UN89_CYTMA|nr:Lipase 2 [Valsa mali var. pyri (nom. inval.)]